MEPNNVFLGESREIIVPIHIQRRRRSSAESRKSFRKLVFANADLEDFQMDPEKLKEIDFQRRASHASNSENRSLSSDRRSDSLCIPDTLGNGHRKGSMKSLGDEESCNSGASGMTPSFERRASFSSGILEPVRSGSENCNFRITNSDRLSPCIPYSAREGDLL